MTITESDLKKKFAAYGITPHENLGQHFLIDPYISQLIKDSVSPGAQVVEIGAGVGNLTTSLAEVASSVTAIEIDPQFEPALTELGESNPHVHIQMGDALSINWRGELTHDDYTQVVANVPYHITEPFLAQLATAPIDGAVLLLGLNAATQMTTPETAPQYGRTSLLSQTFFNVSHLVTVPRTAFYPVPRTESALVSLTPKVDREIAGNPADAIFARLFTTIVRNPMVINVIKEVLMSSSQGTDKTLDKRESKQRERSATRRQAKRWISQYNHTGAINNDETDTRTGITTQDQALAVIRRMGIAEDVLHKSFRRLDNPDIRRLVQGVRRVFSR